MKELKDYLHLYPGVTVYWGKGKCKYLSIVPEKYVFGDEHYRAFCINENGKLIIPRVCELQIELRPLYNMTEEEMNDFTDLNIKSDYKTIFEKQAAITHFLLLKYFDLFSLIEAGLAIYKTKQPQ